MQYAALEEKNCDVICIRPIGSVSKGKCPGNEVGKHCFFFMPVAYNFRQNFWSDQTTRKKVKFEAKKFLFVYLFQKQKLIGSQLVSGLT